LEPSDLKSTGRAVIEDVTFELAPARMELLGEKIAKKEGQIHTSITHKEIKSKATGCSEDHIN
jgi:hypothetical protein